ncbi:unnamed protein product, partial [Trichogramma brassicae]
MSTEVPARYGHSRLSAITMRLRRSSKEEAAPVVSKITRSAVTTTVSYCAVLVIYFTPVQIPSVANSPAIVS